ncbi:hypothetical protein [Rubritalea tangerina]|uniref:hypothetical protein n=1 Tax=Rubritalea tangerina TaxID=430798 RepID=UPI0036235D51
MVMTACRIPSTIAHPRPPRMPNHQPNFSPPVTPLLYTSIHPTHKSPPAAEISIDT